MRYRENRAEQRLSIRLTRKQKAELMLRYDQYVNVLSEHCPLIEPIGFSEWIRQSLTTESNNIDKMLPNIEKSV
jgi:hypothetical protein